MVGVARADSLFPYGSKSDIEVRRVSIWLGRRILLSDWYWPRHVAAALLHHRRVRWTVGRRIWLGHGQDPHCHDVLHGDRRYRQPDCGIYYRPRRPTPRRTHFHPSFFLGDDVFSLLNGSFALYLAIWTLLAVCGAGTLPIAWTRAVNNWFFRSRGLALGLALVGTGLS